MEVDFQWDDLRVFLAVMRSGSFNEGARAMRVNPTTVVRRIKGLEAGLGVKLFVRSPGGSAPTPEAGLLLQHAEECERQVTRLVDAVCGDAALRGTVTIATSSAMATWFIAPLVADFARAHSALTLELRCVDARQADMVREADIAVVVGRPKGGDLLCRRLAEIEMGLFCSSAYTRSRDPRVFEGTGAGLDLVDYESAGLGIGRALESRWPDARVILKTDDIHVCLEALRQGLGITAFPGPMGEALGGLVRLDRGELAPVDVWRVCHPDVGAIARVELASRFLDRIFRRRWTSGREVLSASLTRGVGPSLPPRGVPPDATGD